MQWLISWIGSFPSYHCKPAHKKVTTMKKCPKPVRNMLRVRKEGFWPIYKTTLLKPLLENNRSALQFLAWHSKHTDLGSSPSELTRIYCWVQRHRHVLLIWWGRFTHSCHNQGLVHFLLWSPNTHKPWAKTFQGPRDTPVPAQVLESPWLICTDDALKKCNQALSLA